MCFHDGPGIRTTVFLKGCSIHCPWCSNPENISFNIEDYELHGQKGQYGKVYTPDELVEELRKDEIFWGYEGGVTFSGGEALMQSDEVFEVLRTLKKLNVHTAVETSLFIPKDNLENVLPYIDYFIVDAKVLVESVCKDILGGNIDLYFQNVESVYRTKKLRIFRVPGCKEYTLTEKNIDLLLDMFLRYSDVPIQVFKLHSLGSSKYESLGKEMWQAQIVSDESLQEFVDLLKKNGLYAEEIHI